MKRSLYTVFACTAFLVACGDDDSFTPKTPELPGEVADMDELKEFECNDDLIGKKVYVKDLETDYECDSDHWFEAVDTGKSSSSSKKTSSSSAKSSSSAESSSSGKSSSSEKGTEPAEVTSSSSLRQSSANLSSSSAVSSSSAKSSSSVVLSSSAIDLGSVYDDEAKTLKDLRDNQVYKTTTIGTQTWMAENLNYVTAKSYCYDYDTSNCAKYGRLYKWAEAMDSVGTWSMNGKGCGYTVTCSPTYPVRGICPKGWHLPTKEEWETLFTAVGDSDVVAKELKSTSGWPGNGNGLDTYGFSALPGGYKANEEFNPNFEDEGDYAYFWSSTASTNTKFSLAYDVYLRYDELAFLYVDYRCRLNSVRCVKDDPKNISDIALPSSSSEALSSSSEASSSSVESSSSESSSSSVALATPCKTATEDNCEYGSLTDERDGKAYKTVKIGEQVWMAENLNYAYLQPTETMDSSSFCYKDNASNCDKFGRLYLWSAIIDSTRLATDANNPKDCGFQKECDLGKIQGICPDGWHIPTNDEFKTLMAAVGGDSIACKMLKSTSGWSNYGSGTDPFGFTALPGNIRFNDGTFNYENEYAQFWSTREFSKLYGNTLYLFTNNKNAYISVTQKNYAVSLRCIKD